MRFNLPVSQAKILINSFSSGFVIRTASPTVILYHPVPIKEQNIKVGKVHDEGSFQ